MSSLSTLPPPSFVRVSCDLCGAEPGEPFIEKLGGFYARCAACGFVSANPRDPDPALYNASNNEALGEGYAKKQYSASHQEIYTSRLRSFEPYRKNNRILEIGSSTGGFCFRARELGWEPIGIEPVEAVAAYGRDRHRLDIRASTLEEAALPDGYVDAIFSNAVLEHLPSPSRVLREAWRVLRPGGALFADTVNIDSYTWRFIGAKWKLIDPRAHLSLFTPATLRRFCEQAGFRVARIQTHGVRFHPSGVRLSPWRRWSGELAKLPFSLAARINRRGDRIAVWAEKPLAGAGAV